MKEKKKNEELQSRREFFKRAAKSALPILGAIALTQLPFVVKSHESQITLDCSVYCAGGCRDTCNNTCDDTCRGNCVGTCNERCVHVAYS